MEKIFPFKTCLNLGGYTFKFKKEPTGLIEKDAEYVSLYVYGDWIIFLNPNDKSILYSFFSTDFKSDLEDIGRKPRDKEIFKNFDEKFDGGDVFVTKNIENGECVRIDSLDGIVYFGEEV